MSELDEGFRLEMAEYIRQEKELKVKLEILEQKLAGPEAKLAKAREIVLKAKAAYESILADVKPLRSDKTLIEGELELVAEKKAKLRHDAALAKGGYGMRPGTQAFVEQMNQLAGDPAEHRLKKEASALDAAAALEALKARMGKD
ncbi:MAG: hypothetical protein EP329_23615 [Deltaproteobacteria bacterium]|nr:MAG: hypothetical protein EP329_23615 [Deltaproteobacteria bacterium]